MLINGEWKHAGSRQFEVINPANGETVARVPDGGRADAAAAIDAAFAAFPAWSGRTAYERAEILNRAYQLMMERADELARTMTTEQGKPLRAARIEVQYGADFLLWFAEEAKRTYGEVIPSARSDQRFIAMVEGGAVFEVARLQAMQLERDFPVMRALGVVPLLDYLGGHCSLAEATARGQTETRQYVKRQLTWLRRNMISWKEVAFSDSKRIEPPNDILR